MKKYLIGAIVGFMLSLGVGAHAEVSSMIGKVIDGSFPIKINGKTLTNQALTIEGVSYVPTKEFAESLGATVKFDANLGIEVVPGTIPVIFPQDPSTDPRVIKAQKIIEIQKRISDITKEIEPLYNEYNKYNRKKIDSPSTFTDEDGLQKAKKEWETKQAELANVDKQLDALQK